MIDKLDKIRPIFDVPIESFKAGAYSTAVRIYKGEQSSFTEYVLLVEELGKVPTLEEVAENLGLNRAHYNLYSMMWASLVHKSNL